MTVLFQIRKKRKINEQDREWDGRFLNIVYFRIISTNNITLLTKIEILAKCLNNAVF